MSTCLYICINYYIPMYIYKQHMFIHRVFIRAFRKKNESLCKKKTKIAMSMIYLIVLINDKLTKIKLRINSFWTNFSWLVLQDGMQNSYWEHCPDSLSW